MSAYGLYDFLVSKEIIEESRRAAQGMIMFFYTVIKLFQVFKYIYVRFVIKAIYF